MLAYLEWADNHPVEVSKLINYLEQFDPKQARRLKKRYRREVSVSR